MKKLSLPIRLGILGTGERFFEHYVEVLRDAERRGLLCVVGIYNRTASRGKEAADLLGCHLFSSREELLRSQDVDAIACLLPGKIKDVAALEIVRSGKHLFLETPAATGSEEIHAILSAAGKSGVVVEVAEDLAFSPEAQLQRQVISSGVLGQVLAVFNDEAGFAYHALARLHVLMETLPPVGSYRILKDKLLGGVSIESFRLVFMSGLVFFQRFAFPKDRTFRMSGQWKILCERGVLTDKELIISNDGKPPEYVRITISPSGSLSLQMPDGRKFSHEVPAGQELWSCKRQALSFVLSGFIDQLSRGTRPLYGLIRAQDDIMTWHASALTARVSTPWAWPAWVPRLLLRVRMFLFHG